MNTLDALLDDLAERVAARVLAKLSAPASHYGTRKGATLPPGKSRAWALRNLRKVPGARKVGRDWIVSVADFDAWASERDTERLARAPAKGGKPANDVEALAEEALAAAGLRRMK